MKRYLPALLAAILSFCLPSYLPAQELSATLTGTVTDATGAVVPKADVTMTRDDVKGEVRNAATDSGGNYTITNLPAGTYTLTVTAPGFKTFSAEKLVLFVAQKRAVNAVLQTGAVNQTVTVQANAVTVNTSTSEQAGTVSGEQVRELELNNRNFEQLVTLQPGVVSGLPDEVGFGLQNADAISVNGARDTANNWSVDGSDINDSGSNGTLLNVPSIDAIQEFTLERSSYDASYGRSAGGQVLVQTKSGTSQFHGDLYEFGRNTVLNANSFFNNMTGEPRSIEHYNDYGFTLGGPLYIPKVYNVNKNKTFFFWSEEWRHISQPVTASFAAPSQAQLNGMVTGQVTDAPAGCVAYDAATNTSTISPACYSQNSKVYLANVFKYAANSGGNYSFGYSQLDNTREDIVRLDENLTTKIHLFARAMQDETPENYPLGLFAGSNYPGLVSTSVNAPGENVVANMTYTITPSLVNEAEFAYSQGTISSTAPNSVANSATVNSQLTGNTAYKDPYGRIPNVSFVGGILTGFSTGFEPYHERNLDRTLFDNLSFTHGNHTVRAGYTVSQMLKTENASSGDANFSFNTWQDFLLGNVAVYSQGSRDIVPDLHYYNMEAYIQDDWKVRRRLTLNLGMRWSFFPSPTDAADTLNNFDPLLYNPSLAPAIDANGNFVAGSNPSPATYANGLIFPTGSACSAAQAIAPQVQCSPFGARVNPNSNNNFAPRFGFAYDVFGNGQTSLRGGYGIFYDRLLNGVWEQNAFVDPPLVQTTTINNTSFDNPLAGTNAVSEAPNQLTTTGTPTFKVPSYMDYNLSLEQQVGRDTVFQLAYVGSLSRHLLGEVDLNQPTLNARAANPYAQVNGVRPYAGYSFFESRIPIFTGNYNSMQVSLNHRVSHGLTLGIAYTWSRNLSDQSNDRGTAITDTYNPRLDYGPTALNTPNIFIANYVYDLPFFKGQHGVVGHVLGGWEVSGITTVEDGQSTSVYQAADPYACVASTTTANGCVAGTYPGGIGISNPDYDIAPRADQVAPVVLTKKLTQWFSTGSFAEATGHFGSARNGIFLGPGLQNWDLGAMKNVDFLERYRFQFRGEFFNAFNHTNYDGVDNGINDPSYGQVTSTHNPREVQLAAKLYF